MSELMLIGTDQDQPLALRSGLQLQNAPNGRPTGGVAAEAIAGFGCIGDDPATLQKGTQTPDVGQGGYFFLRPMARQPMSWRICRPEKSMSSAAW